MNTDLMLKEDADWLVLQVSRSVGSFCDVANKIDLRQEDWSRFWSKFSVDREEVFDVCVNGKEMKLSINELNYLRMVFGYSENDGEKIIFNSK